MNSLLSALCTLLLLQSGVAVEDHGGECGAVAKTVSPCGVPLENLYGDIEKVFGANYTVFINCLSFDEAGLLKNGVMSGTHPTEPDLRFVVECRGDILLALNSPNPVNTETDIRGNYTACSECVDSSVSTDICVDPCSVNCERCYNNGTKCSRCIACTMTNEAETCKSSSTLDMYCRDECLPGTKVNHELYNHCECTGVKNLESYEASPIINPEEEEHEEIHCPSEELSYTCTAQCSVPGHTPDNNSICFACGLEYCVRCDIENPKECLRCLAETVLYEHECIACPLAPFAIEAILQEHEVELEEKQNEYRTIELAVVLPILSVLIIIFFVSMSIFAHHRYPHIAHHGRTRHRRPPSMELSGDVQEDIQESHVWRPRATISLR